MAAQPALLQRALLCPLVSLVVLGCPDDETPCGDARCADDPVLAIPSFEALPPAIRRGEHATLSWQSRGAARCAVAPGHPVVPRSGSLEVRPLSDTRYTLSCDGAGGRRVSRDVTVEVRDAVVDAGFPDAGAPDGGAPDGGAFDGGALDAGGVDGGAPHEDAGPSRGPAHRWSFTELGGDVAHDSVGNADGLVRGGAGFDGDGGLSLDGESGYVDLPNGLLSPHEAVTVEAWVVWDGPGVGDWQRIFDCGSTSIGEVTTLDAGPFTAEASAFLQLSPQTNVDTLRATVNAGDTFGFVEGPAPLPSQQVAHVALSYRPSAADARLYVDGALVGSAALAFPLAILDDVNCWLGRSNYSQDPGFDGTLLEVRLYPDALSHEEVEASFTAGPDVLWSG